LRLINSSTLQGEKKNTHEKIVGKERKDGKLKQIKKKEIKISGT
jgi:hypothetical protein